MEKLNQAVNLILPSFKKEGLAKIELVPWTKLLEKI